MNFGVIPFLDGFLGIRSLTLGAGGGFFDGFLGAGGGFFDGFLGVAGGFWGRFFIAGRRTGLRTGFDVDSVVGVLGRRGLESSFRGLLVFSIRNLLYGFLLWPP